MSISPRKTPLLGVIEGFYGQPWSREDRLQMARWLPAIGIQAYLYAPKADAALRKAWRSPWTDSWRQELSLLADRCHGNGLVMGVGLSPFALYEDYSGTARSLLREKVAQIADLGVTALALLFDDMPGTTPQLAAKQAEICHDIVAWSRFERFILCPTYYSDDPVLERVFGARPSGYLEELAALLPPSVELFWTGPRVCSTQIAPADLNAVHAAAGSRLALWDNYPVNDSKSRSEHLYLRPLQGRDAGIGNLLGSHWCNAMNQAALSLPALATLPALYGVEARGRAAAFAQAGITRELLDAGAALADIPRTALPEALSKTLHEIAAGDTPAADELRGWLTGAYVFDPACLTD